MPPLILERKMHKSSFYFCFQRRALEIMTEVKTHIPLERSILKHTAKRRTLLLRWPGFVGLWRKAPGLQVKRTQRQSVTAGALTGGPNFGKPHIFWDIRVLV